ncbi:MAG: type II CAAX endopeptidase family protein [Pirellulales bacterium]
MTARTQWPLILIAISYPSLLTWFYFIALAGETAAVQQTAYTAGKLVQFGFPIVWAWFYRRSAFGLPKPRLAGVLEGLGFGALVAGGMLAAYHFWLKPAAFFSAATEPILAKVTGLGLLTPVAFIALGVFYSLGHSLLEEYYWRWFVFARLAEAMRLRTAIIVSSIGFAAHHVLVIGVYFGWTSLTTWLFSFCVAIGGAAWAWLYHRSGSLVGPWLSHLLVDASIFAIGYDVVFNRGGAIHA